MILNQKNATILTATAIPITILSITTLFFILKTSNPNQKIINQNNIIQNNKTTDSQDVNDGQDDICDESTTTEDRTNKKLASSPELISNDENQNNDEISTDINNEDTNSHPQSFSPVTEDSPQNIIDTSDNNNTQQIQQNLLLISSENKSIDNIANSSSAGDTALSSPIIKSPTTSTNKESIITLIDNYIPTPLNNSSPVNENQSNPMPKQKTIDFAEKNSKENKPTTPNSKNKSLKSSPKSSQDTPRKDLARSWGHY